MLGKPVLVVAIVMVSTAAAAGIYKWVDERDGTVYADGPSGEHRSEVLTEEPAGEGQEQEVLDPEMERQLHLKELDRRCKEAIRRKVAPLWEAAIQACVANEARNMKNPRAYCTRYYRNYGETGSGDGVPDEYQDLPACAEAERARNATAATEPE